jgi:hypothetical protein
MQLLAGIADVIFRVKKNDMVKAIFAEMLNKF